MKHIALIGLMVLLIPSIFTGCPSDPEKPLESMTFVDDAADPSREFTINENLGFTVRFLDIAYLFSATDPEFDIDKLDEDELKDLEDMGIIEISGFVQDTNHSWKSPVIMGTARNMYSNNAGFTELVALISIDIVMGYEYLGGEISAINVAFSDDGDPLIYERNIMSIYNDLQRIANR